MIVSQAFQADGDRQQRRQQIVLLFQAAGDGGYFRFQKRMWTSHFVSPDIREIRNALRICGHAAGRSPVNANAGNGGIRTS